MVSVPSNSVGLETPDFAGRKPGPLQITTSHYPSLTSNQTSTRLRIGRLFALLPNLALPSRLRVGFFVILFFITTSAILASTRFGSRLTSLFTQIRPASFPAFTRPITTSTMAPKVYQKPPQAPPSFTATTTSLVDDAKAICGTCIASYSALGDFYLCTWSSPLHPLHGQDGRFKACQNYGYP